MAQSIIWKTLGTVLFTAILLTGCEKQGPAERTGEAIDDAARKAGEQIEEAREKIQDCVDDIPDNC